MPTQSYSISQSGSTLDPEGQGGIVVRENNQTNPQRETPVLSFTCPDNFDSISYVSRRDPTRFVPRTMESVTATDDDGSAALEESERTFQVSGDIIPVTGETELSEQPYPVVVVVNTTQGTTLDESDLTIDYSANTVTVADSAVAIDDALKLFPVISEGTVKFQGRNTLNQSEGPIYPWSFPLYRFHDMKQDKRGTEINLSGSVTWKRNETLEVVVDSPQTVVWEDADYPDSYVSTFEQDVEITF